MCIFMFPVNPTPKQAGAGTESPSDLPSHLDYPIILEQPTLEEGKSLLWQMQTNEGSYNKFCS